MKTEDEESAPRNGADKPKKKAKKKTHLHIGPHARAYRAGLAFCPVCDAEKGLRLTGAEREAERASEGRSFERTRDRDRERRR